MNGGSATEGSDFTAASGTLTFAPGDTTQAIRVVIADDNRIELNETYSVVLSAPTNAALATNASVTTTHRRQRRADRARRQCRDRLPWPRAARWSSTSR